MLRHFYDEPGVGRKSFSPPPGPLLSPLLLLVPFCLTFVALVFPPGFLRTGCFLPLVVATAGYGLTGTSTSAFEHLSQSIIFSSAILQAFALLFSVEAERDLHRLEQKECPPPFTMAKAKWAAHLMMSVRGVGWNFKPKSVGPGPTTSRTRFCLRQLLLIIVCWLGMDLVMGIATFNAYYLADTPLSKLPRRVLYTTNLPQWGIWLMIQISPALAALVTVALGLFEPKDWPPTLGSFWDMTTVAGFWGRYWHQFYRSYFAFNGKRVMQLLPAVRADLVMLFAAFLQSGLLHAALGFASWRARFSIVLFFVIQPFAILAERAVSRRLRAPKAVAILVGFGWTMTWLFGTAALLWTRLAAQGFFREDPLPINIWGRSEAFQQSEEAKIYKTLWHRYTGL